MSTEADGPCGFALSEGLGPLRLTRAQLDEACRLASMDYDAIARSYYWQRPMSGVFELTLAKRIEEAMANTFSGVALREIAMQVFLREEGREMLPAQPMRWVLVAMEEAARAAISEREFVHAESSRIYSRLSSAVASGADDSQIAKLLRDEVAKRA